MSTDMQRIASLLAEEEDPPALPEPTGRARAPSVCSSLSSHAPYEAAVLSRSFGSAGSNDEGARGGGGGGSRRGSAADCSVASSIAGVAAGPGGHSRFGSGLAMSHGSGHSVRPPGIVPLPRGVTGATGGCAPSSPFGNDSVLGTWAKPEDSSVASFPSNPGLAATTCTQSAFDDTYTGRGRDVGSPLGSVLGVWGDVDESYSGSPRSPLPRTSQLATPRTPYLCVDDAEGTPNTTSPSPRRESGSGGRRSSSPRVTLPSPVDRDLLTLASGSSMMNLSTRTNPQEAQHASAFAACSGDTPRDSGEDSAVGVAVESNDACEASVVSTSPTCPTSPYMPVIDDPPAPSGWSCGSSAGLPQLPDSPAASTPARLGFGFELGPSPSARAPPSPPLSPEQSRRVEQRAEDDAPAPSPTAEEEASVDNVAAEAEACVRLPAAVVPGHCSGYVESLASALASSTAALAELRQREAAREAEAEAAVCAAELRSAVAEAERARLADELEALQQSRAADAGAGPVKEAPPAGSLLELLEMTACAPAGASTKAAAAEAADLRRAEDVAAEREAALRRIEDKLLLSFPSPGFHLHRFAVDAAREAVRFAAAAPLPAASRHACLLPVALSVRGGGGCGGGGDGSTVPSGLFTTYEGKAVRLEGRCGTLNPKLFYDTLGSLLAGGDADADAATPLEQLVRRLLEVREALGDGRSVAAAVRAPKKKAPATEAAPPRQQEQPPSASSRNAATAAAEAAAAADEAERALRVRLSYVGRDGLAAACAAEGGGVADWGSEDVEWAALYAVSLEGPALAAFLGVPPQASEAAAEAAQPWDEPADASILSCLSAAMLQAVFLSARGGGGGGADAAACRASVALVRRWSRVIQTLFAVAVKADASRSRLLTAVRSVRPAAVAHTADALGQAQVAGDAALPSTLLIRKAAAAAGEARGAKPEAALLRMLQASPTQPPAARRPSSSRSPQRAGSVPYVERWLRRRVSSSDAPPSPPPPTRSDDGSEEGGLVQALWLPCFQVCWYTADVPEGAAGRRPRLVDVALSAEEKEEAAVRAHTARRLTLLPPMTRVHASSAAGGHVELACAVDADEQDCRQLAGELVRRVEDAVRGTRQAGEQRRGDCGVMGRVRAQVDPLLFPGSDGGGGDSSGDEGACDDGGRRAAGVGELLASYGRTRDRLRRHLQTAAREAEGAARAGERLRAERTRLEAVLRTYEGDSDDTVLERSLCRARPQCSTAFSRAVAVLKGHAVDFGDAEDLGYLQTIAAVVNPLTAVEGLEAPFSYIRSFVEEHHGPQRPRSVWVLRYATPVPPSFLLPPAMRTQLPLQKRKERDKAAAEESVAYSLLCAYKQVVTCWDVLCSEDAPRGVRGSGVSEATQAEVALNLDTLIRLHAEVKARRKGAAGSRRT